MSDTNTIDAPAEQVTFSSKASNLRIVRDPARRKQLGESGEYEVIPGKSYQFYDGVLGPGGLTPDDIDWLRGYQSYGKLYFEPETAPVVENSAGLQRVIMEKALAGDFGAIADILVAERTALSRPEVIAACEAAINAGGGELPAKPETPLHELQRVRVGPTAGVTPGVSPDPVPGTPLVDPSTLQVPVDSEPAAPVNPPPAGETIPVSEIPAVPVPTPEVPPLPAAPEGDPTEPPAPDAGAPGEPA